jgi:hypothetical protein
VRRALLIAIAVAAATFPAAAAADTVYTVDNGVPPFLGKFDTATPQNVTVIGPVTGMVTPASEVVTSIDFRAADGRLYAVSNQNRLYTIDTSSAVATVVGDTAFTPAIPSNGNIGTDFDPVRDVLRLVSDGIGGDRVNLRISPTTGQATVDTKTDRAPGETTISSNPCVAGLAYTNPFPGAQSTTLYGVGYCGSYLIRIGTAGDPFSVDGGLMTLVEQINPYVNLQGGLRLGLDIAPNGDAYALVQKGPSVYVYRVDLREGAQTLFDGVFMGAQPRDAGTEWRDIAIAPAANDFSFSAPSYAASETSGSVAVTVNRTGPALGTASVAYSTTDGSATSPADYTPVSGTLDFAAGQRSAAFSVPIIDDAVFEGPKSLGLALSAPRGGAASLVDPSSASLTIADDEPAPPPPGPGPGAGVDTTAPTLGLSRQTARRLAAFLKGVKVTATPGEPAALKFELIAKQRGARIAATKDVVLASTTLPIARGARTVTLKPSKRIVGKPKKAFAVRLRVTATDPAGNAKVDTKTFSVKPDKQKRHP